MNAHTLFNTVVQGATGLLEEALRIAHYYATLSDAYAQLHATISTAKDRLVGNHIDVTFNGTVEHAHHAEEVEYGELHDAPEPTPTSPPPKIAEPAKVKPAPVAKKGKDKFEHRKSNMGIAELIIELLNSFVDHQNIFTNASILEEAKKTFPNANTQSVYNVMSVLRTHFPGVLIEDKSTRPIQYMLSEKVNYKTFAEARKADLMKYYKPAEKKATVVKPAKEKVVKTAKPTKVESVDSTLAGLKSVGLITKALVEGYASTGEYFELDDIIKAVRRERSLATFTHISNSFDKAVRDLKLETTFRGHGRNRQMRVKVRK